MNKRCSMNNRARACACDDSCMNDHHTLLPYLPHNKTPDGDGGSFSRWHASPGWAASPVPHAPAKRHGIQLHPMQHDPSMCIMHQRTTATATYGKHAPCINDTPGTAYDKHAVLCLPIPCTLGGGLAGGPSALYSTHWIQPDTAQHVRLTATARVCARSHVRVS